MIGMVYARHLAFGCIALFYLARNLERTLPPFNHVFVIDKTLDTSLA